ncbi:MAG: hypothetical protein ABIQ30_06845 [Devosia sp.]
MSAALLPVANSYAVLSADNSVQRLPRAPRRKRPASFGQAFDDRTLFYDCFWHDDGQRIVLVGPPPLNLKGAFADAHFSAAGVALKPSYFASLSVMITALSGVPIGISSIDVTIAGETFAIPVQPSSTQTLAGRRLLFSVNRDNDLDWIREWALFHARVHGTDVVILFDNGSTRYSVAEVAETLRSVPGLAYVGVPSWPYSFGPIDPAVRANPYWARFFQIGTMSVLLRRYGERAAGLLDCDIDELAGTRSGTSIYDLATQSKGGLAVFRGTWIEASGPGTRHRDFTKRLSDPKTAVSPQRKWALDPSRAWVRRLSVHPYWHWIEGRALFSKSMPADATYWHFKGINTNWKQDRTTPPSSAVEDDVLLKAQFGKLAP